MQSITKLPSELTADEITERVAILHRLRNLLELQRTKFHEYLVVLEKQHEGIACDDTDTLMSYTELEQDIVSHIGTVQRVIQPLEDMYRNAYQGSENEVPQLKADLTVLQEKVLAQNKKNRDLLTSRMIEVRRQISALKNPYAKRSSVYASDSQSASIIDIQS